MRFFNKKNTKVACDLVFTGSMIVAAHSCEGAMTGSFMTTSEAIQLSMQSEARIYQVLVSCGHGVYVAVTLTHHGLCKPIFDALKARFIENTFVTLCGKPVLPDTPVAALNVQEGSCFISTRRMCGGSSLGQHLKTSGYSQIQKEKFFRVGEFDDSMCDDWILSRDKGIIGQVLQVKAPRLRKQIRSKLRRREWSEYEVQAWESDADLKTFLDKHLDRDIVCLVEDLALLCVQLFRAQNKTDKCIAMVTFIKLRTGKSLLFGVSDVIEDLVADVKAFYEQSEEDSSVLKSVTDLRGLIANWDKLQESSIAKSVLKVYKYAIAVGALSAVGVKIDAKTAKMCKKELDGPLVGPNFVVALLDTVALFIQRSLLYAKTGMWSTFFHGPTSYMKWFDQCSKLKREFLHMGDLEAHGTSYHQFVLDLSNAIESGNAILRFGDKANTGEILAVKKLINELLLMQADMFTYNEAQKSRRPPFSMLVYGKTCVGKSQFSEVLFQWAARVMNLPRGDEFRYVRNSMDDFWSGWNSSKWFVQLDDIAFLNPDSQQKDMSLAEVIQLVNDVPMVPNQARLEDKGKNPMRARMVVATTNTKHLNAHAHFACPIAVQRRFPFVITVQPKPQFACDHDMEMIDSNKLPAIEDDWPNYWIITVERVVAQGSSMASFEQLQRFDNIQPFLFWLKDTMVQFQLVQAKAKKDNIVMSNFELCQRCDMVTTKCVCPIVDEYERGDPLHIDDLATSSSSMPSLVTPTTSTSTSPASTGLVGRVLRDLPSTGPSTGLVGRMFRGLPEPAPEERDATLVAEILRDIEDTETEFGSHLQIQAGEFPIGRVPGEPFTTRETEGIRTWIREYDPAPGNDPLQYNVLTRVYDGDRLVRESVAPAHFVTHRSFHTPQSRDVEMADVIAEVVRIQAQNVTGVIKRTMVWGFCKFLDLYSRSRTVRNITNYAMTWRVTRSIVRVVLKYHSSSNKGLFKFCGEAARAVYVPRRWRMMLGSLAAVTSLVSAAGLYMVVRRKDSDKPQQQKLGEEHASKGKVVEPKPKTPFEAYSKLRTDIALDEVHYNANEILEVREELAEMKAMILATQRIVDKSEEDVTDLEVQGLRASVDASMLKKSEKESVWKRDDFQISSFDVSNLNVAWKSLSFDQVNAKVLRNVARIRVSNGERVREGNAFCVAGHLWVTNSHTFFTDLDLEVTLLIEQMRKGASPNVTFKVRQTDLYRAGNDLVFFEVFCWEVKSDLRDLFVRENFQGNFTGALVGYAKHIEPQVNVVKCVQDGVITNDTLGTLHAWHGYSRQETVVGDCGMPLVVHEPVTMILGIHTLGNKLSETWSTRISREKIDAAVKFFKTPVIQCAYPVIDAPSKPKQLTSLRIFSPLRWLESGSVRCFGSFTGYSVTSRSKVRPTLLGEKILAERQWDVDYGAPNLKDWRPWNIALNDIMHQQYGAVDPNVVKECARAFKDDILELLPEGALDGLHRLDAKTTINGAPGVKFVDKMNFKSSMGEPYNTSKKHFLVGSEGEMEFLPEILDRIDYIENCYKEGRRAAPVFSGKLKDEARKWAKIYAGKIRVFTGAPADWSFVVREHLLTMVKLIQENPFIFEASPGCTVQSLEWEEYFDYLTQFGADRIIGGDYGFYDKKMEALWILQAFWILAEILMAAGWTYEEVLPVYAMAEDVAYSYVNFDGDLLMFFGSNPSGQPLTVIINCLVNALYMRYAYVRRHPEQGKSVYERARTFKKNVALLTYGDDNGMNVRRGCDWFNHTAIQDELAEIGVKYTMADKEAESRPYIHISEFSYLKRTWRWDEDIGAVVCPLEEESIHKMLTICCPSDESREIHMASVMVSAVNEWFWYGKEKFETERAWIVRLAEENDLTLELSHKKLPTWDELVDRFYKASEGIVPNRLAPGCVLEHPRSVLPN